MLTRVGFIGLGVMGKPMACNLISAGHQLTVHNRSRAAVDELVERGAHAASSSAQAAATAEIVITMLPDSPDVCAVMDEVLGNARRETLVIDMSTISPLTSRELGARAAERGILMLDAPVSGGDVGARNGTLSIMVGGAADDLERARPVLEVLGQTIVHVGPAGAGQIVKACNQVVVALTIQAVCEGLVLGAKAGVDPERILDVLSGGLAGSKVMEVRRRNLLDHDFAPGFRSRLHAKDLGIALACAREFGVALPGTAVVAQMFTSLLADERGDEDHSALLTVLEGLARTDGDAAGSA